jgi:succinoglycan biosynthesis protein ExoM
MNAISVDICIATYKRPQILIDLLDSLGKLDLDGINMRIIVVDNDPAGSARAAVDAVYSRNPIELKYVVEAERGISHARNRALELVDADYFAFVDDDEYVTQTWLKRMLNTLNKYNADAVFGPVQSVFPDSAPSWACELPAFKRRSNLTGTFVNHGDTGNVLVRTESIKKMHLSFDPSFSLTGGEDIDFFYRMFLSGKTLVWCEEALIYEKVPEERLNIRWILMRAFRKGQSFFRVFVRRYPFKKKIKWLFLKPCQVLFGILILPFMRISSYKKYLQLLYRIYAALGQLSMVFGNLFLYQEYSAKNYRQ